MKKILIAMLVASTMQAMAETPGAEASKKGKAGFNCCKGRNGSCAIYVAEETGTPGMYSIPPLTTVFYSADYAGPYLPGAYMDGSGRMRVDNVHVTLAPSDCIDPDTGLQMADCSAADGDMFFSNPPSTPTDTE